MKKIKYIMTLTLLIVLFSQGVWAGKNTYKYPMSFFWKARTAKTVGYKHLSVALKLGDYKCDEVCDANGNYSELKPGEKFESFVSVATAKYGWRKDHHLALGVPYIWTEFESSKKRIDENGFGNIFVFEKWQFVKETDTAPAFALDAWYFFPSGDTANKIGSDDDSVKIAAELSKAYGAFSFHLNPGYIYNLSGGSNIHTHNAGIFWHAHPKLLPAVEYNYIDKEGKGHKHSVIPGLVWRFAKGCSAKLALNITADTTMKYKDDVSVAAKIFKRF